MKKKQEIASLKELIISLKAELAQSKEAETMAMREANDLRQENMMLRNQQRGT